MKRFTLSTTLALLSAVALSPIALSTFGQPAFGQQLSSRSQLSDASSIQSLVQHNRDVRNKN
ncbi:MAG: hypothetical protein WA949_22525 [Phormidesmis sp.]